jgi:septum formation protein
MTVDPTAADRPARRAEENTARHALVLASASPRRADLLAAADIPFEVAPADVDETPRPGERPGPYVERLAREKADAIIRRGERRAVLGADTVVVIDDVILGKPIDLDDARRMLEALSGRRHVVMTGVTIVGPASSGAEAPRPTMTRVVTTTVEFARLSASDLDWYVASGEPMGKAGAYAVQGRASRFVTAISGSYANVVGLPIAEVRAMCSDLGILIS